METLIENKTKKLQEHSVSVLKEETIHTFKDVWEFINFNEYQYNNYPKYSEDELKYKIAELSLNQRKKLKRVINAFRKKRSLASANRFYHFVYAKILQKKLRVRINYSDKQLKIIEKRKKFVKLREEMLKALNEYKQEKSDFYKLRLEKGQSLQ